jgi:hypothetical protein
LGIGRGGVVTLDQIGGGDAVDVEEDEQLGTSVQRGLGSGVAGGRDRQRADRVVARHHVHRAARGRDDIGHFGVADGDDHVDVGKPRAATHSAQLAAEVLTAAPRGGNDGGPHGAPSAAHRSATVSMEWAARGRTLGVPVAPARRIDASCVHDQVSPPAGIGPAADHDGATVPA